MTPIPNFTIASFAGLLLTAHLFADPLTVQSPDGTISASFEISEGRLSYSASRKGEQIVGDSQIEIIAGAEMVQGEVTLQKNDSTWKPVWGQFSEIRDHHNELSVAMTADGIPVELVCRVFDAGMGFRFNLSKESKGTKLTFASEYKPLEIKKHFAGQQGKPLPNKARANVSAPVVSIIKDGLHLGFFESDLFSAADFEYMKLSLAGNKGGFRATSTATSTGVEQVTAWRTLLISEAAGDLAISTVALNLAAPCAIQDTSWIQPGKGLWDWRVHGYDNGDFLYGIDTLSYFRYIDFCAKHGLEYFTVDDHWFTKAKEGKMKVSPDLNIKKVMNYAKEKNVKIMLYYDRKKGNFGDETLFDHYSGLGATGMKYGFMGNHSAFTRNGIKEAAKNRLLINFHDGPVPMTGVERTMPNLISREYCHGQQDSRKAFTPKTFIQMALVSSLTGPLDMSNGNFGIASINAGEREKGPRKKDSYISTVVSEVARNLVIYTGLVTFPDAPEEYTKKLDLFDFLKQMPSTWDESRVLHSEIGTYITTARRSGDSWFIGSVNNEEVRTLELDLDFLQEGVTYEATIYEDAEDSHGVKNPEAYVVSKKLLKKGNILPAKMAVGGGHALILKPSK